MTPLPLLHGHAPDDIRAALKAAGLKGPHAFIRGLDQGYDLDAYLDRLLHPLAEGDDFRVAVDTPHGESWVLMERLPWDSAFFDRGIARLDAVVRPGVSRGPRDRVDAEALALARALETAAARGINYVFSTVEASDLASIRLLSGAGFELIETRCHYHKALSEPPRDRFPVRLAGPTDVESLARAARMMVNHFDRFHSDLAIPEKDADRLMEQWVRASILDGFADATIVPDEPDPEAFCTAKYHREHWEGWGLRLAQPVLSAVAPRHRGWYVRIISELGEHLRSIGAEHAFLVTQITNNAVIRCWEKLGYQFGKGEHVFRRLLP